MTAREQFTILYRTHYDFVLRYAVRRADPDTAQDVAAETFLVVWRRWETVPDEAAHVLPWLYAIAAKTLAGSERSRRRRGRLSARIEAQPFTEGGADLAAEVATISSLHSALGQLSPSDQEVLRLAGWEELDLADIAIVLGCAKTTAAGRLHRARRRLFAALERSSEIDRRNVPLVAKLET